MQAFQQLGVEKWRTTTGYTGDSLSVVPPKGATPTTKILDAQGKTTELRQYHGASASGAYDVTRYGYDNADRLTSVTDSAGNVWRTSYDLLGHKTKAEDPDKGTTTYTYTDLDQVASTQDGRGKKLFFDYDVLGRHTAEHADAADGPKLAEWIYDKIGTTNIYGQAVSAIRYADGDPAKAYRTDVTGYDGIGNLSTQLLATTTGSKVQRTYSYETGTNRLTNVITDREKTAPFRVENSTYSYDHVGNVTKIGDQPENSQPSETQCFQYDYLQRVTDAWTAGDDCAGSAGADTIDKTGPAPYWQSYAYDLTGNRTKQTDHVLNGNTAQDTTKTYAYPAAGDRQPHALQSVTTVAPPVPGGSAGGTSLDSFGYDETGNTTRQTVAGNDQTFEWDAEGHLTKSTKAGATTSFVYDADGDRLLRREPGATTLYLGDTELRLDSTGVSGTRYYTLGDATVAIRTTKGVQFLADDHHGTATRAIDAITNQVTQRYYTPYGSQRGAEATDWPGQRGFVGGTTDATLGMTRLGAGV